MYFLCTKQTPIIMVLRMWQQMWYKRHPLTALVATKHRRPLWLAVEVAAAAAAATVMKMQRLRHHAQHAGFGLGRHPNRWFGRHLHRHQLPRSRLAPAAHSTRCCVPRPAPCSRARDTGGHRHAACATARAAMTTCSECYIVG